MAGQCFSWSPSSCKLPFTRGCLSNLARASSCTRPFDEVRADLDPLPKGKLICCNKDVSDDSSELQGITYNGANYLVCVCQQ